MMRGTLKKLLIRQSLILVLIVMQSSFLVAQHHHHHHKDTSDIYKRLKKIAQKHKVTKLLYESVFTDSKEPLDPSTSKNISKSNNQKKVDPNAKYVGRIIRSIKVEVYDPFGHSVNDTMVRVINRLQKLGNKTHVTTRGIIIRNLLLFKKNDKVDILKVTESERIIRQIGYVNDARIYLTGSNRSKDSVDVKVVVQDRWSWDLSLQATSATSGEVAFRDYNLIGSGQQLAQSYSQDFSDHTYEYDNHYIITNIGHTYISSTFSYILKTDFQQVGESFDRPFYSPLAKWAGGVSNTKTWATYSYLETDSSARKLRKTPLEYFSSDYWIGRSFNPGRKNTIDNRSRNFTIAVRYANTQYQYRPPFTIDTNKVNTNSSLYIGNLGYTVRRFYKDKYIYRFGANEDIPEGWLVQGLYGVLQREEFKLRYYLGFQASYGKHFSKIGYLSGSYSYGSFFNKSVRDDATVNLGAFYFSDLYRMGRWSLRQFLYYKFIYGINKTSLENITLNSSEMYGFASGNLKGTRKMVLNLETVLYSPIQILGFRFAPVILMGFGMVDTEQPRFFQTQIYQSYATGFLIRNENLITSSLQITVGAYPYTAPGTSTHFRVNPIAGLTLKVYGFAMTKPAPVAFQ